MNSSMLIIIFLWIVVAIGKSQEIYFADDQSPETPRAFLQEVTIVAKNTAKGVLNAFGSSTNTTLLLATNGTTQTTTLVPTSSNTSTLVYTNSTLANKPGDTKLVHWATITTLSPTLPPINTTTFIPTRNGTTETTIVFPTTSNTTTPMYTNTTSRPFTTTSTIATSTAPVETTVRPRPAPCPCDSCLLELFFVGLIFMSLVALTIIVKRRYIIKSHH